MVQKKILYIAMSLDGYIATKSGSVDWLIDIPGYDFYDTFIKDIGAVVMGRKSYEMILSFGIEWPYKFARSYVLTHSNKFEDTDLVKFTNIPVKELVEELSSETEKDIWVLGGGEVVREFLESKLIDEIIIGVMPILLGEGIPLFREGAYKTQLKLLDVKQYEKGMVQLHYEMLV
ncbi:dihydrofolate reductase family protein [Methanococcoides alaskense]|uniref:Dihydrofolate reductase n=1 Tax=Methanococcoides alaskense TaxID=325778 RepID=A0AA90TXQ5_9EURY|nr:dihydrofolate reductase family protein [Methanococcoides alaskense]MDA0525077.1 dihydrofolate reductase family protein [Methanococcoides alaskense]MDR6222003.1 dihydrofolate reductase [Methanococcoides alaskense]